MKKNKKLPGYMRSRVNQGTIFLIPSFLMLSAMMVAPLVFVVILAFNKWNGSKAEALKFVGLDNFRKLGTMPGTGDMIRFTLIFGFTVTVLVVVVSVLVAFALDKPLGRRHIHRPTLRVLWYLPTLVGGVAVGIVWRIMYNYTNGLFNAILNAVGIESINWLNGAFSAGVAVIVAQVWAMLGINIVLFLAGLQGIPVELYEAAVIDGASRSQQRWKITLPMLMPTITISMVTTSISAFKAYELPYTISKGLPGYSTRLISQSVQELSIGGLQYGPAAALSLILMLFIVLLQLIQLYLLGKKEESYG